MAKDLQPLRDTRAADQPAAKYSRLVEALLREIQNAKADIAGRLVASYWNMGRWMDLYLGKDRGRGALAALSRRLAKDTGISQRTLEHCHQFVVMYPDLDPRLPINWSHYRHLLTVKNNAQRESLEKRIIKYNLNSYELKRLIGERRENTGTGERLADAVRGLLYHYRIIKAASTDIEAGGFMVDCGFSVSIVPPAADFKLNNKRIVSSAKTAGGYKIVCKNADLAQIYTYKAALERVVDGDTLLANIDCGFGIWTRQRLRLRGVDAPEKRTYAGAKAFDWVKKELEGCPFIIVKTHKSDKYDRYLADVFYERNAKEGDAQPVADQGKYLNAGLVARGLAGVWR